MNNHKKKKKTSIKYGISTLFFKYNKIKHSYQLYASSYKVTFINLKFCSKNMNVPIYTN